MNPLDWEQPIELVVHGSWTPPSMNIGADEIRQWHLKRGFTDIGYHYVITRSGTIEEGRGIHFEGAHVKGQNHHTVGICLVGGKQSDPELAQVTETQWEFNYTFEQMNSLGILVTDLSLDLDVVAIKGHRDYPNVIKRCPGFDVQAYFAGVLDER